MQYRTLISTSNLELAWRRIVTGRNFQYKRFFRSLYLAYEIAHKENIHLLHQRLKGAWQPSSPHRIFLPKASGLQRPISLLPIEDQIVYQAVANSFALKLQQKRKQVERKVVFSNVLNKPKDSKFFTRDWHDTYRLFQNRNEKHFKAGYKWIAQFDFAAFYDTISHELLIKAVAPRGGNAETWSRVREWLKCWSTVGTTHAIHHGIPQGPIASDFLAECLLLPLDLALMKAGFRYVRYVDDIRIFARSQLEAQEAAIQLEVESRNLGLIPQSGKFHISKIDDIHEVIRVFTSLTPPDRVASVEEPSMFRKEAESMFDDAVDGRPLEITDSTLARYVLYRAPKSPKILRRVLLLLPRHPEHIDAFVYYLSNYNKSVQIERTIAKILKDGAPYSYVRGALWLILSRIGTEDRLSEMQPYAKTDLKRAGGCVALRWGAMSFLLTCQALGLGKITGRLKSQPALVQALLIPGLPEPAYQDLQLMQGLLKQKAYAPGIMLAEQFTKRGLKHTSYFLKAKDLPPQTQNVFRNLGLIRKRSGAAVDQVDDIFRIRYKTRSTNKWKLLLGGEYTHALSILLNAEAVFDAGRSHWLQLQNSFNDILLRRIIDHLTMNGLPGGGQKTIGKDGKLVNFGTLLDPNAPFARAYPKIADAFRSVNDRRNKLPASHPYDQKGGDQNKPLMKKEQRDLVRNLRSAYNILVAKLPK